MDGVVHNKPSSPLATNINFLELSYENKSPSHKTSLALPPPAEPEKPKSYLEHGFDGLASLVITDQGWRNEFDHYAAGFLTTAAMFTKGKLGIFGTVALSGLNNASPDTTTSEQLQDFALGAAKGGTVRGLYGLIGDGVKFAPTKGILMGLASRGAEDVFQRDLFTDPSKALGRVRAEATNKSALAFDAMVWTAGEGIFYGVNKFNGNALARSKYGAGMFMGATFGALNGGSAEIMRQQASGDSIDWTKVFARGAVQGTLDAAAARVGMGISDPAFQARVKELVTRRSLTRAAGLATLAVALSSPEDALASQPRPDAPQDGPVPQQQRDGSGEIRLTTIDGRAMRLASSAAVALTVAPGEKASAQPKIVGGDTTISLMAPLLVGDAAHPEGTASKAAWAEFDRQLTEAKNLGVHSISTDVWWGVIEPKEGQYNWSYYEKLAQHITAAGLKWTPILSFHQCGGNVGDNVTIMVPDWVWTKLAAKAGSVEAVQYVSEQGHASKEYVSAWADDLVLDNYANVMRAFQNKFAPYAKSIAEINVSLGPAGELRFPSYNQHDQNTGYPTRGALQSYSELAKDDFRAHVLKEYGGIEGVRRRWNLPNLTEDQISPPTNPDQFFAQNDYMNLQYGKDFFDWYNGSLIKHGKTVLGAAVKVFGDANAPFFGIDIGAKVPGVHWHIGERTGEEVKFTGGRMAELAAGLIRTSGSDWDNDADGRGYRPILSLFKDFQPITGRGTRVVPAMTALELEDGQEGPEKMALPHSLAEWVGKEAVHQNLHIRGENALDFTLHDPKAWDRMSSLLILPKQAGYYSGLTLLRMGTVVNDPTARAKLSEIINAVNSVRRSAPAAEKPAA